VEVAFEWSVDLTHTGVMWCSAPAVGGTITVPAAALGAVPAGDVTVAYSSHDAVAVTAGAFTLAIAMIGDLKTAGDAGGLQHVVME
jgi:hypothetical protein